PAIAPLVAAKWRATSGSGLSLPSIRSQAISWTTPTANIRPPGLAIAKYSRVGPGPRARAWRTIPTEIFSLQPAMMSMPGFAPAPGKSEGWDPMKIALITPVPAQSRQGNRVTALRWARILKALGHCVTIAQEYDGAPYD